MQLTIRRRRSLCSRLAEVWEEQSGLTEKMKAKQQLSYLCRRNLYHLSDNSLVVYSDCKALRGHFEKYTIHGRLPRWQDIIVEQAFKSRHMAEKSSTPAYYAFRFDCKYENIDRQEVQSKTKNVLCKSSLAVLKSPELMLTSTKEAQLKHTLEAEQ